MRRLALALAAASVLAACSNPCQDLGDRLCRCAGVGTTRAACKTAVKDDLARLNPSKDVDNVCNDRLDTCHAPADAEFCEWLDTSCGKASCGLSADAPADVCAP
jgi:hypothetical protein